MNTFTKEERLCSKKLLEKLHHNGSSFLVYPFRIVSLQESLSIPFPAQVVFAVPKRKFKHAVDRNLLKRRMREIYRINKEELLYSLLRDADMQLLLSIHYVGKEILEFGFMEKKMKQAIKKLTDSYLHETA